MKNKRNSVEWSQGLGIIFTNNETDIMKLNLEIKISQFDFFPNSGDIDGKGNCCKKNALPKLILHFHPRQTHQSPQ